MRNLLEATIADVREAAQHDSALLVSPTHVLAAAQAPHVATVAGYPTGRHHSLIKASEARLAVQSGAAEVWVAVDALLGDATALLTDLITVREACPQPVALGLIVPSSEHAAAAARAAAQAGFDKLIYATQEHLAEVETQIAREPAGALPALVWPTALPALVWPTA
ncbi:deoxyribose-phosphate aldolase [Corynebacterium sp. HMSC06C06]|nr:MULTISPECIES: deoxyribose-phosphate aldolase [Corynebacterium]MDK8813665.1 deoxyribose-phosphate aldolase [Corynebacterium striatum]OFT49463.1 deoxyribose-phosphate aldolase [Corynebacterium sp. HMSC06C06]HAT1548598.1 deoxyribose-phosphate aldolase [Corynebacterium striatum]